MKVVTIQRSIKGFWHFGFWAQSCQLGMFFLAEALSDLALFRFSYICVATKNKTKQNKKVFTFSLLPQPAGYVTWDISGKKKNNHCYVMWVDLQEYLVLVLSRWPAADREGAMWKRFDIHCALRSCRKCWECYACAHNYSYLPNHCCSLGKYVGPDRTGALSHP